MKCSLPFGIVMGLCLNIGLPALASPLTADGTTTLIAAKTKKKKRRTKRPDDELSFGPEGIEAIEDSDMGVGIHRIQEGVDAPYFAEVNLLTDISLLTTTIDDSEDDPVQSANYSVDIQSLFILGMIEIGPDFSYRSESIATSASTTDAEDHVTVSTIETSTTEYSIGGIFKLNLGDLDRGTTIFFGYGGVGYRAAEVKVGENEPSESSGLLVKAGGGMNVFMDSNVAFNPRVEFRYATDKDESNVNAVGKTTTGLVVLVGIGVFI